MQTMKKMSALLLLLGLFSTACERDNVTRSTNPSPLPRGSRSPCGFNVIPVKYDPLTGRPTQYEFKYYLCELVAQRQNWWWYELELSPQMVETLPRTVIDDFRVIPTAPIDGRANTVLLRFSKNALVMQHYQESRLLNRRAFTLTMDLILTASQQQTLGLQGHTVKAGSYPVIYDSINQTYNAVLFTQ